MLPVVDVHCKTFIFINSGKGVLVVPLLRTERNRIAIIVNLFFIVNSIQIEEEQQKLREREAKLWSKMLQKKKKKREG